MRAFGSLIQALSIAPMLVHLDDSASVVLSTDASVFGLRAVLSISGRGLPEPVVW